MTEDPDLVVWAPSTPGASGAALAKGELRGGRVLGLASPSPKVGAWAAVKETGASSKAIEDASCWGDPGGVVLPPPVDRAGVFSVTGTDRKGGGGNNFVFPSVSGFGVVEGDLVCAWGVSGSGTSTASGMCSGDGERERPSPSSLPASSSVSSPSGESSDEKLSDRNDRVSSSKSDPESVGLSGISALLSSSLGAETSTKEELWDNEDPCGISPESLSLPDVFDSSDFACHGSVSSGTEIVRADAGWAEVAPSDFAGAGEGVDFSCIEVSDAKTSGSFSSPSENTDHDVLGFS